jgi:hypothetical protein
MENANISAAAIEQLEPGENHEHNGNSRRNEVEGWHPMSRRLNNTS